MTGSKCFCRKQANNWQFPWEVVIVLIAIVLSSSAQADNINLVPQNVVFQQDPILLWTKILSYLCISVTAVVLFFALSHFTRLGKSKAHPVIFRFLSIFLIGWGILHIMRIWNLFHHLYWIMAAAEVSTGAVALMAAIAFWPLVPRTAALKGSEEFDQMQEQLRESEKYFQLLISGIKDYAIFLLDPKGTVMTWNDGAERIKGYKAEEVIGHNVSCFFSSEDREKNKPLKELEMAAKNGRYEEEGLRIRKDGSQFWADVIITALFDSAGELTGFSKVTRDITEKKLAINALQEQAALLDLSNDAIIVRDLDGTIYYWSQGAKKMYGYTEKEAIGKNAHNLLKIEFPKSSSAIEQSILVKGRWDGELVHYTQNGKRLIVESRQALKTDVQGQPTGVLEINTDITDRKEVEKKQSALAEMERVNSELEQFASVASHDLQEPLRAISSCLQILEKTYKGRLDDNADQLIHYAIEGAQRMRILISDLLVLSRVDREEMSIGPTDLQAVLNQVKTNLATAISENEAAVIHNGLPVLSANGTLLTMLFQNLISNAIKFRGNDSPQIHINASRENGHWLFSLSDNGIGFDQKYADQIFRPFKRLHSKDKYPGTGIGLPICKRIIERHGGKIWVESQPGLGTTFRFTISELGGSNGGK